MLRAVPDKLFGVLTMFGSIGLLFLVPWLDTSKVRSMRYRPAARSFFLFFVAATLVLGWCGSLEPNDVVIATGRDATGEATGFTVTSLSRILAIYYYAYFLLVLPVLGLRERPSQVPETISTPVLPRGGPAMLAGAPAEPERKG